jgi:hypothetical protein
MTEAASQHTHGIGELIASLYMRSSTSPRCVLLSGPAGPFLLKDAARPRLVSHTDDWIGCAEILSTAQKAPITARNADSRIRTIRTRTRWPGLLQHSSRRTE